MLLTVAGFVCGATNLVIGVALFVLVAGGGATGPEVFAAAIDTAMVMLAALFLGNAIASALLLSEPRRGPKRCRAGGVE